MALANLGRSRSRTVLVVLSLCLSVVLLNVLAVFVQGFDEERYLDGNTCADVVAGDYPAVGEEITVTYVQEEAFFDRCTGQFSDETTPDEDRELRILRSRDVTYTVCAWVDVPYAMSYRFNVLTGYDLVLPVEALRADSPDAPEPMAYLFDTPDAAAEEQAEAYLAGLTDGSSSLMYESKAIVRAEFSQFQYMFLLLGGALCAVVAVVGVLNFFNAIMTGILARRREFAVLQAIGMTGRQLRAMLVWEGLFYALGAVVLALVLSLGLLPAIGHALEGTMRFFVYRAVTWPILLALPVFAALGAAIPLLLSRAATRTSLVERLREA